MRGEDRTRDRVRRKDLEKEEGMRGGADRELPTMGMYGSRKAIRDENKRSEEQTI